MTVKSDKTGNDLATLRNRIDHLDRQMHEALMERASVIDQLITVKETSQSGIAFRPGREASMMRDLMAYHNGTLPAATVEHVWREIIAAFTNLQASFSLHLTGGQNNLKTHDAARFQFGFAVPIIHHNSPDEVIDAVTNGRGDLGLIPLDNPPSSAWWHKLSYDSAPQIIARLPFVIRENHPAPAPAVVISKPVEELNAFDRNVYSLNIPNSSKRAVLSAFDTIEILTETNNPTSIQLLISAHVGMTERDLVDKLQTAYGHISNIILVGGYAAPYTTQS